MGTAAKKLAEVFSLSDYEAQLYFAALEAGETTVSALAERSGIPRTAVYPPLKVLTAKGFVSPLKTKGKRTLYRAVEPKHLLHLFEHKRIDLQEIIEQFSASLMGGSGEVWVRYFEGREGLLEAAYIFLEESGAKSWKTFENPFLAERLFGQRQFDEFIKARVKKGIRSYTIIPSKGQTPWAKEVVSTAKERLLEIRMVPPEHYPIEATLAIAGDWIFVQAAKQKPFALVIKNGPLARTLGSMHDMIWDRWNT
jgi:sugar-specific transcriptional regulator TrmB